MAIASGRYVLLLNPDTVVLDGAIQKTLRCADEHPDAAVVACKVLDGERVAQHECFLYPSLLNVAISSVGLNRLLPRSRFFGRERMTWRDLDAPMEAPAVAGCFMLVRREAIDDVGPMDEAYFMFAEETDWCWRMTSRGWKVLYFPGASVVHHGGASTERVAGRMLVCERRSILRFIRKREGALRAALANLLMTAGTVLRLAFWALQSVTSARARQSFRHALHALRFHLTSEN